MRVAGWNVRPALALPRAVDHCSARVSNRRSARVSNRRSARISNRPSAQVSNRRSARVSNRRSARVSDPAETADRRSPIPRLERLQNHLYRLQSSCSLRIPRHGAEPRSSARRHSSIEQTGSKPGRPLWRIRARRKSSRHELAVTGGPCFRPAGWWGRLRPHDAMMPLSRRSGRLAAFSRLSAVEVASAPDRMVGLQWRELCTFAATLPITILEDLDEWLKVRSSD